MDEALIRTLAKLHHVFDMRITTGLGRMHDGDTESRQVPGVTAWLFHRGNDIRRGGFTCGLIRIGKFASLIDIRRCADPARSSSVSAGSPVADATDSLIAGKAASNEGLAAEECLPPHAARMTKRQHAYDHLRNARARMRIPESSDANTLPAKQIV